MSSVTAWVASIGAPLSSLYAHLCALYRQLTMADAGRDPPRGGLARTAALRATLELDPAASGGNGGAGNDNDSSGSSSNKPYDVAAAPFFHLSDEAIVLLFKDAFAPELQRLQVASPTVEATTDTPRGHLGADGTQTPSRLMYGADYAEVNRSIVSVLALKWLIRQDYVAFTRAQSPKVQLQRPSFDELRALVIDYLRSATELYALLVATFANDLGKDSSMFDEVKRYLPSDAHKINHDEIIYLAAIHHDIAIIDEFPAQHAMHEALILGLRLGVKLNVAQFAQAENVPGSLASVNVMQGKPAAFDLKYLEIIFDVAGAQGHNDARGACSMTEPVWRSYAAARGILATIVRGEATLRAGYDQMLDQRASVLAAAGWRTLTAANLDERALLRILCMGRVTVPGIADRFAAALDRLAEPVRTALIAGLSVDGIDDGAAVIPYYAPSLFANVLRSTETLTARQQIAALQALLRFLARVYHGTAPRLNGDGGRVVECYLDFARDVLCGDEFPTDPSILDELEIPEQAYTVPFEEWEAAE